MRTILLLDLVHPDFQTMLEGLGYGVVYNSIDTEEALMSVIAEYDGLVVRSTPRIQKGIIDAGKKLKFIARVGSGTESIEVEYAEKQGVTVLNSPEGNCDAVGEHALGLLIALNNKIPAPPTQTR